MKKVPKFTDFTHQFEFTNIIGDRVIPLNFTMTFYSAYGNDKMSFKCRNGICDSGLSLSGSLAKVVFNKPAFSGGQLSLNLEYQLPDATYSDGLCDKRFHTPLNITITTDGTSLDDNSTEKIVLDYTISGTDYATMGENESKGEFWYATDGVTRRQVYYQTFKGSIPTSIPRNGATWLRMSHTITIALPQGTQQVKYVAGGINGIKPMDLIYNDADMYGFSAGTYGILLYFTNEAPSQFAGKPFCITFQYIKR